jgi:hypothetical protein
MRYLIVLFVAAALTVTEAALLSTTTATVHAQTSAQDKAANLRNQLSEVEAKQLDLQTRLKDLDEQMKPENISSALAGVGSTHPEDLREQRRRQLEIERNGVQAQLNLLATSHTRLETAIAQADAEAYRQSAAPPTANSATSPSGPAIDQTPDITPPTRHRRLKRKKAKKSRRTHHAQMSVPVG